ncbi:MAG: hypothetical protein P1U74_04685 [Legionellaceae bacterium]|nr:hypothetical protein [Legionellaceae bacterium]
MFKKVLFVLLVVVCFISSSYASFSYKFVKVKRSPKPLLELNNAQIRSTLFTDFSGDWNGECTMKTDTSSDTISVELSIKQDEHSVEIKDHDGTYLYQIDEITNNTKSYQGLFHLSFETMRWNEDKTKLIFNARDIETSSSGKYTYTYFTTLTLSLENGNLCMLIDGRDFDGMTPYFNSSASCTLSKSAVT